MFVPHCQLGDNSTHHFQDPELLIDVAIMDCKEEITVVQYMLKEVFKNYDPEKRYGVIYGCNKYVDFSKMCVVRQIWPQRFKNFEKEFSGNKRCLVASQNEILSFVRSRQ